MPIVPRRNPNAYVPPGATPTLRPGNAFTPAAPIPIAPAVQQIGKIIEQRIQRAEEVGLLEADNRLSEAATDLRTGALQKRGKDALAVGVQVQEDWEKTVSEVESSLTSDRQRAAFRERSSHRWQQLNATIQEHGSREFQKYDAEQTEVGLKKRVEEAVTNYADPRAVRQAVSEAKYLVELYGSRNGFSTEQLADRQLAATTQIHASVISRMVADGNDQLADKYFKQVKPEISSDTATQLTQRLEVASTEGTALRAADDIWKKLGPKNLNDPVVLTAMEQEARDKYADNPKVQKAIIQDIRSRREAHNADQTELTAANKATVLGAFSKGASVASLTRSAAYLALTGTDQEQLKRHMLESQRADANRPPDKKNWAAYWGYSEPARLASMSDNQVLALAPEIGQGLVNQLMQQKRSIGKSEDAVRAATIDADLFGTIASDAGLQPYDKNADKEALGRLRSTVELEIGREQQRTGKVLTGDERAKVMQRVIDQHVMLDQFGATDPEVVASTLTRDQRGNAYVPLERIPPTVRTEALNWMRSNGLILPGENDQTAIVKFKRRIEKAYAARMTGGNAAEIDAILRGK